MDNVERLERLEATITRMKRWNWVLASLAAAGLFGTLGGPVLAKQNDRRVVVAREFRVVDPDGRIVGMFGLDNSGLEPRLELKSHGKAAGKFAPHDQAWASMEPSSVNLFRGDSRVAWMATGGSEAGLHLRFAPWQIASNNLLKGGIDISTETISGAVKATGADQKGRAIRFGDVAPGQN